MKKREPMLKTNQNRQKLYVGIEEIEKNPCITWYYVKYLNGQFVWNNYTYVYIILAVYNILSEKKQPYRLAVRFGARYDSPHYLNFFFFYILLLLRLLFAVEEWDGRRTPAFRLRYYILKIRNVSCQQIRRYAKSNLTL